MLKRIASMPASRRKASMAHAAREEWQLCADDIFYWMDPAAHIVPYVHTRDPKPLYSCNLCPGSDPSTFDKRHIHLQLHHNIEASTEAMLRQYFVELPTIRPMPMKPYFRPLVETWLREPLFAIEKSRDMSLSWLMIICYTWDCLFHKGRQNLIQSETASKTRDLIDRAGIIFQHQPKWLKEIAPAEVSEGSSRSGLLKVPSLNSEMIGFPQGADKVRQYHPTGFLSDEAAFNPNAAETFAAVRPAVMGGGRYTAISSPQISWFMSVCRDTLDN